VEAIASSVEAATSTLEPPPLPRPSTTHNKIEEKLKPLCPNFCKNSLEKILVLGVEKKISPRSVEREYFYS
jgi:hypothetical protein